MGSTFTGIEVAKRSLFTQEAALLTTSHNVANANTKGYTRQVVNMVASRPQEAMGLMKSTVPGQRGQGVEFSSIDRIREQFLDDQYHNQNKNLGDYQVQQDTLDKIQGMINEPSDTGIRSVVENFWNSWQELSKTPENTTARVLVKENGLALTDAFNQLGKQLNDLSTDLTTNINTTMTQANSSIKQIASLNDEISRVEGLGDKANDLRDQRDLLLDDLSNQLNVTSTDGPTGYTVKMGNVTLVSGKNVQTVLTTSLLASSITSGDLNSGSIHGMIVSRDGDVANFKSQLDNMVKTMATGDMQVTLPQGTVLAEGTVLNLVDSSGNVTQQTYSGSVSNRTLSADTLVTVKGLNGLHELGYTGISGSLQTGVPFFALKAGATDYNADSVTVNPDIVDNAALVSTSMRTSVDSNGIESVVTGNNDMALAMASVQNLKVNFDSAGMSTAILPNGTIDEFYNSIVGEIGVKSQDATRQATNQQVLVEQIEANRQSVSGVSMDEEMANMIKFQHAYEAAARSLTSSDECLNTVINGMGLVGRG